MPRFVTDVEEIRRSAARKIEDGAVTDTYQGDVEHTIDILNDALATEIVCVLRYMHHYFMATGVHGMAVRDVRQRLEITHIARRITDRFAEDGAGVLIDHRFEIGSPIRLREANLHAELRQNVRK